MKVRVPHGSASPIDLRCLPDDELLRWLGMLAEQLEIVQKTYKELIRKGKAEAKRRGLEERREPQEETVPFGPF